MTTIGFAVHLEAAGDADPDRDSFADRVGNLLELLVPHHAGAVTHHGDGTRVGTTVTVDAADVVSAVELAARLFAGAAREAGLPDWPIVHVDVMTEAEQEAELGLGSSG